MTEDINFLSPYLKKRFGKKVYKISLNGGMTCPNRDGTIGTGGCIFCSEGGSGDFAISGYNDINEQIEKGKSLIKNKLPKNEEAGFIAYYQAYSNTYQSVEYLEKIFYPAIENDEISALSIATRPDCLEEEKLELLGKLNKIKPVFIELGLQTSDEKIAKFINRGYDNSVFEEAVRNLNALGLEIIVHIIVGLPCENMLYENSFLDTIKYINKFPVNGVKFQLLHILKGTQLEKYYKDNPFPVLEMNEYIDIIINGIKYLRKDIVIHRITGDGPKKILVAPLWSGNKRLVLNTINNRINKLNVKQGELL